MIALSIPDIKNFMKEILTGSMFDRFYLCDSEIVTFSEFKLGGYLNRPYFDTEEWDGLQGRELCLWSEVKPVAFAIIKGKKLPVRFKLVFQLSDENTRWLITHNGLKIDPEDIAGLHINIIYDHRILYCTTGTSFKTFMMDKTLERAWDDTVKQYMKQRGIVVEEM